MRYLHAHETATRANWATTPLPAHALTQLASTGFCVVPNWLSDEAVDAICHDAELCKAAGLARREAAESRRSR